MDAPCDRWLTSLVLSTGLRRAIKAMAPDGNRNGDLEFGAETSGGLTIHLSVLRLEGCVRTSAALTTCRRDDSNHLLSFGMASMQPKHLPADERRSMTVDAVVAL